MRTYLELEGKLGPKLQPQFNQSRPAQPNTNPCVRKETKATEKRKRLTPAKKYKVKVVSRPDFKSSNATAQPPLTAPNAPTNSEAQNPSQVVLQRATPHHPKTSQFMLAPHGLKQGRCQGTSLS